MNLSFVYYIKFPCATRSTFNFPLCVAMSSSTSIDAGVADTDVVDFKKQTGVSVGAVAGKQKQKKRQQQPRDKPRGVDLISKLSLHKLFRRAGGKRKAEATNAEIRSKIKAILEGVLTYAMVYTGNG